MAKFYESPDDATVISFKWVASAEWTSDSERDGKNSSDVVDTKAVMVAKDRRLDVFTVGHLEPVSLGREEGERFIREWKAFLNTR